MYLQRATNLGLQTSDYTLSVYTLSVYVHVLHNTCTCGLVRRGTLNTHVLWLGRCNLYVTSRSGVSKGRLDGGTALVTGSTEPW